jgi:hypothetical protein
MMMWECHCPLVLDTCDLDNPRCADFHRATYRELAEGLWEHEKMMADDLEMWRQVRAAENESPLVIGPPTVMWKDSDGTIHTETITNHARMAAWVAEREAEDEKNGKGEEA